MACPSNGGWNGVGVGEALGAGVMSTNGNPAGAAGCGADWKVLQAARKNTSNVESACARGFITYQPTVVRCVLHALLMIARDNQGLGTLVSVGAAVSV